MMTENQQHALDALRTQLRAFLMEYLLTHTCDKESGERFPLVDRLCAPGDGTNETGKAEVTLLAEAIVEALPQGAAQAVRDGNLHAVMEAAAWRNAMTGLCKVWPKTADEAAEHLRRRLHPVRAAASEPVDAPAPAAGRRAIDYTVVQAFADQHGVPYNAACAMVRAASAGLPVRPAVGDPPHSDIALLDWLERHGTVNFDYETAQVRFNVPESLREADTLRDILQSARAHQEQEDAG